MATGFVQRWKGKILGNLVGVGAGGITAYTATGGPINLSPNDIASLSGAGTLNATASTAALAVNGYGVTKLSSIGGSTYNLGAPVARRQATIYTDAIGDGARKVSSTAAGATFQSTLAGAGFLNFSTTVVQTIVLIGLSTSLWGIRSNYGSVTVSTS